MTSHGCDVVVKMLEDRCGWCILSGYKCYSTIAIIVKYLYIITECCARKFNSIYSKLENAGTQNHEIDGILPLLIICRHFLKYRIHEKKSVLRTNSVIYKQLNALHRVIITKRNM